MKWFNWLQKACLKLAELPPATPVSKNKDILQFKNGSFLFIHALKEEKKEKDEENN